MTATPTYVLKSGDGTTTDFVFPFPYLRDSHVKVSVDSISTPREVISPGVVRIEPAPPTGTNNIRVYRETQTTPLVNWADAGSILGGDLNDAARQSLYIAQEAVDKAAEALAVAEAIPAGPPGPPGASGSGTGDMVEATYDPQAIHGDAFARANHTGTQPLSSVTSLEASLNALSAGKADTAHTHPQSAITDLETALAAKVPTSRTVSAGTALSGGGDLSANRTISAIIASQAEAEAGSESAKLMSPLRTAQAIAALATPASTGVANVRLGAEGSVSAGTAGKKSAPTGHVITALNISEGGVIFDIYYRPIQKLVDDVWSTIGHSA